MKKTLLLSVVLFLFVSVANSQSQRKVLLEHFTQASCGPCAGANPIIQSLLDANPDKITSINYHTSWPGYDPMYNHNTQDNGARTGYYTVSSVPNSVLDGNVYNGHPNGWNINTVNNRYAVPSPASLYLFHELSPDNSTIYITMLIEASEDIAAGTKAHLAVIEEFIQFSNPPGSNGETEFHNVMKKLLPSSAGTTLTAIGAGEYIILEYSWEVANVYNINELAAVGFLQNNSSKEVMQAEISSETVFPALYSVDADIKDITYVPFSFCTGNVKPHIVVRNNGSDALTSFDITYSVNGGDPLTKSWTGNLGFLESEEIELDQTNFSLEEMNEISFEISSTNGGADDYVINNTITVEVPHRPDVASPLTLALMLDDHPEETTWEITDSNGDPIYSGGPYSDPGQVIIEQYSLPSTGCYTFSIYDAGGNGFAPGGSYAVADATNLYLAEGTSFGAMDFAQFGVLYTDVDSYANILNYKVAPNPASDYVQIDYQIASVQSISFELVNVLGEVVYSKTIQGQRNGQHSERIDLTGFDTGLYFINTNFENENITQKIIVTK